MSNAVDPVEYKAEGHVVLFPTPDSAILLRNYIITKICILGARRSLEFRTCTLETFHQAFVDTDKDFYAMTAPDHKTRNSSTCVIKGFASDYELLKSYVDHFRPQLLTEELRDDRDVALFPFSMTASSRGNHEHMKMDKERQHRRYQGLGPNVAKHSLSYKAIQKAIHLTTRHWWVLVC